MQRLVRLCVISLAVSATGLWGGGTSAQDAPSNQLNYHQLTSRSQGIAGVGTPVLSGDGVLGVFGESPGFIDDPDNPNKVFVIDYVRGDIVHLYHGARPHRRYLERHLPLRQFHFDPKADVRLSPSGLLEWSSAKPALRAAIKDYFLGRHEDA